MKKRPAMGWTVRGSNPVDDLTIHVRPDRPWGPPSLLCYRYRVSFPRVKRPVLRVLTTASSHMLPYSFYLCGHEQGMGEYENCAFYKITAQFWDCENNSKQIHQNCKGGARARVCVCVCVCVCLLAFVKWDC